MLILTYLNQVQNKIINCYVYQYDQGMFIVVNATCIEFKDPINIVTIVLMQHALDQRYCLDLSLNNQLV